MCTNGLPFARQLARLRVGQPCRMRQPLRDLRGSDRSSPGSSATRSARSTSSGPASSCRLRRAGCICSRPRASGSSRSTDRSRELVVGARREAERRLRRRNAARLRRQHDRRQRRPHHHRTHRPQDRRPHQSLLGLERCVSPLPARSSGRPLGLPGHGIDARITSSASVKKIARDPVALVSLLVLVPAAADVRERDPDDHAERGARPPRTAGHCCPASRRRSPGRPPG